MEDPTTMHNFSDEEDEDEDDECPTIIKKSYSADSPWINDGKNTEDDDSEEDSDAEFLVHPCLRSLIKSKSAYTVQREKVESLIKPSKTTFEMSLSRMITSTTKSLVLESEASVADLIPCLDAKWPEPEDSASGRSKKKKRRSIVQRYSPSDSEVDDEAAKERRRETRPPGGRKRCSGCWSSPPNVFLDEGGGADDDDETAHGRGSCWSAPEFLDDDDDDVDESRSGIWGAVDAPLRPPAVVALQEPPYSTSYPLIDTPDHDPSVCSYRLPSSPGSAPSPSPPRPLSPVFGRPADPASRMPHSRSMQLPSSSHAAFLADVVVAAGGGGGPAPSVTIVRVSDDSTDDDDDEEEEDEWPQCDPWPQQEVWPERRVARECWTDANGGLHRSATFQVGGAGWRQTSASSQASPTSSPSPSDVAAAASHRRMLVSRSAHSNLYDWGVVDDSEMAATTATAGLDANSSSSPRDEAPKSDGLQAPENDDDLSGSAHSQLDDLEAKALATRKAWMERGSIACLGVTPENAEADFGHPNPCHPQLFDAIHANGVQSQYGSFSSLAMSQSPYHQHHQQLHQQMRRSCTTDEFRTKGRRRLPRRPDELYAPVDLPQSKSMYERALREQIAEANAYRAEFSHGRRPPTLALQKTVNTLIDSNNASTMPQRFDCANLETPISPHVLPSPGSSGRRLPPLPVHTSAFLHRLPATMSAPTTSGQQAGSAHKPAADHTLCFMDGMGDSMMERSSLGIEDSYYEEDGINGNRRKRHSRKSFFSPDDSSGVSSCTTSDSLNPTHRVQSAFHPRHNDEVLLEIGDAVHIDRSSDDHWSYGTNLRTGQAGIFPTAVVCEIDIVEEICLGALPTNTAKILSDDRDTFYLTMLASIEVGHHKGNDVLVQAMNKVLAMYKNAEEVIVPQTVLMEISFRGIHVIDKRRKNFFQCPTFDFFYSLQNISFCGAHPKQLKYFGFITKHPLLPRFACHVFMSSNSTQPIVESIGRAFKRSYDEYMAFAHPTEDIYLE